MGCGSVVRLKDSGCDGWQCGCCLFGVIQCCCSISLDLTSTISSLSLSLTSTIFDGRLESSFLCCCCIGHHHFSHCIDVHVEGTADGMQHHLEGEGEERAQRGVLLRQGGCLCVLRRDRTERETTVFIPCVCVATSQLSCRCRKSSDAV